MNAARARELTEENIKNSSNTFREDIDSRIEKAVKEKKFAITIYNVPGVEERPVLKKFYCDKGFTWTHYSGRGMNDGDSITISW
jgi:hypothetical protein